MTNVIFLFGLVLLLTTVVQGTQTQTKLVQEGQNSETDASKDEERAISIHTPEKGNGAKYHIREFLKTYPGFPSTTNEYAITLTKLEEPAEGMLTGWKFSRTPRGKFFRMSAWVLFKDKVPPKSKNFGFKLTGKVRNEWVDGMKPNEWKWISIVEKIIPNGDFNHVFYIIDSVPEVFTIYLSGIHLAVFEKEPKPEVSTYSQSKEFGAIADGDETDYVLKNQENENQQDEHKEEVAEVDEATGLCIRYEEGLYEHFIRECLMFYPGIPEQVVCPFFDIPQVEALKLWGLGYQGRYGDQVDPVPSMFWVADYFKWHAYEKEKGKDQVETMKELIAYAETILDRLKIPYPDPLAPGEDYYKGCKGFIDEEDVYITEEVYEYEPEEAAAEEITTVYSHSWTYILECLQKINIADDVPIFLSNLFNIFTGQSVTF